MVHVGGGVVRTGMSASEERSRPPTDRRAARSLDPALGSASTFVAMPFHWTWARWLWRRLVVLRPAPPTPGVQVEDRRDAPVPLRIHRPDDGATGGALLWLHGGGLMMGTPSMDDARCGGLTRDVGIVVVAPAYRVAPEHPFPAALDDAHAAWTWLQEAAPELGLDPTRIAIGGASAGAGIAACLAQRLRDEGGVQPAAQLLVYPMLDDATAARRELDAVRHLVWTNRANRAGWRAYLGRAPGAPDVPPYASASRRDDLTGLPPAWIGVGDLDLFLAEDRAYADRLEAANVRVARMELPGVPHGFDALRPDAPPSRAFAEAQAAFLREALASREDVQDRSPG